MLSNDLVKFLFCYVKAVVVLVQYFAGIVSVYMLDLLTKGKKTYPIVLESV